MSVEDAIAYYHSLLDEQTASDLAGFIETESLKRKLAFGGRQLCTVLRPNLLSEEQIGYIQREVPILLSAFRKLYDALLADPGLRHELRLSEGEAALIAIEPGFAVPTPSTRLDSFFTDGGLHFVEYNAESPAGIAYEDGLASLFEQSPLWPAFTRRFPARHLASRPQLLETLLQTYHEWAHNTGKPASEKPVIAIVDWEGLPTQNEFELLEDYFNRQGVLTFISNPDAIEYQNGKLFAAGRPLDLLYKRVLTSEFLNHYGPDRALAHPIVQALHDGNVCMTNSFRAKLLHKKAIFALLTDPQRAELFDAEERRVIREHIPWTRRVVDTRTAGPDDRPVELLAYIRRNRQNLVLKPNDEYGGKGVLLGWEMGDTEWEQAIQEALQGDYLAQERVPVQKQIFPSYTNRLIFADRMVDLDPYIFNGEVVRGILTRLAASSLLNVTAGGGSVVPTFLV